MISNTPPEIAQTILTQISVTCGLLFRPPPRRACPAITFVQNYTLRLAQSQTKEDFRKYPLALAE
jgi:hypothetical protein